MVSKERSSATKSRPRLLCCFTGSPVFDTDGLESPVHNSNGRSQHTSSWSKFRAKKKTVPISTDTGTEFVTEISDEHVLQKPPAKPVVSAKKGYFRMFQKKTSSSKLNDRHTNIIMDSPRDAICQVFSRCASPSQQPALLCEVPEPIEIRTSPTRASLANPKTPTKTKAPWKKRTIGAQSDRRQVVFVLLMLAVTLGTMLLGGRALAVLCTSAWFYMSPYLKYLSRVNNVAMKSRRERSDGDPKQS